jgi:hypothetical protein
MNIRTVYSAAAALLILSVVGCHKHAATTSAPKTLEEGMANLRVAMATASPEVQSNYYHSVTYGIRYGDYANASLALQRIAGDASLNDQQKKAVSDVDELLKQAMANAQNPAAPAK